MSLQELFSYYLEKYDISQKDLAKETGFSPSLISRFKSGLRCPSLAQIEIIGEALAKLTNNEITKEELVKQFIELDNQSENDFEIIRNNLFLVMDTLSLNLKELANYLNYDASYLSKIKSKTRTPVNKDDFTKKVTQYLFKKINTNENKKIIEPLIPNLETSDDIFNFLVSYKTDDNESIKHFLEKLDTFSLNDYIKAIHFDELKVPSVPFYLVKEKSYYGLEEMKKGELDFFKSVVLNKKNKELFMYSELPMEDMASDIEFGKAWMFAIACCLKKGMHLNIIHNLDRPFKELLLGLESWIPMYMTGQISPYYFKNSSKKIITNLLYTTDNTILSGSSVLGDHKNGKYFLTSAKDDVKYFLNRKDYLLNKANPLMNIYRVNLKKEFHLFLEKMLNSNFNYRRILNSLPLYTLNIDDFDDILNDNNIDSESRSMLKVEFLREKENVLKFLKNNNITEEIPYIDQDNFELIKPHLALSHAFYGKKIFYSYEKYCKHYKNTLEMASKNSNLRITIRKTNKTFKNLEVLICKGHFAMISKEDYPTIHFIIKHPKLIWAIDNFIPPVVE